MKYYLQCLLLIVLTPCLQAQQRHLLSKGEKAFLSLKYADAIYYYEQALKKDTANFHAIANLAESYYKTQQYGPSLSWYERIAGRDTTAAGIPTLRYAQLLAMHGRYPEAGAAYRQWLSKGKHDAQVKDMAALYESGLNALYKDSASIKISLLNISSGYADFSPAFFHAGLAFVSDRPRLRAFEKVNGWNGGDFLTIYLIKDTARIKDVTLRSPELDQVLSYAKQTVRNNDNSLASSSDSRLVAVNRQINYVPVTNQLSAEMVTPFNGDLNKPYHEGPFAFNTRQDTLAITYNTPAKSSRDGISRLELRFFAAGHDEWKALPPFPYNNPDYSIGLPAFHPDGKVIFFTSDMPGGLGGKDIYYSLRTDSGWASPVNAGPLVNTAGDDMFPYVSREGVLYFSSDRWPGLGGLDIFKVKLDEQYKAVAAPENLGAPFNSSRNDFSILWKNNGTGGYFSSDRRGNDDIYGFSK